MSKALVCLNYHHRVQDNPLLIYCAQNNLTVIPFVLFEKDQLAALGAAEKLWLSKSLVDLNRELDGKLLILISQSELKKIIEDHKPTKFLYGFHADTRTGLDYEALAKIYKTIEFESFNANNIFNFDEIRNKSGGVFKVFTPFYKHCLSQTKTYILDQLKNQLSNDIKNHINILKIKSNHKIEDLKLLGSEAKWNKKWQEKMLKHWDISISGANKLLDDFAAETIIAYPQNRDIPALVGTSKLSPYLHFGMISPFRMWFDVEQTKIADCKKKRSLITKDIKESNGYDGYLRQLCWREFAQYILYHFPHSSHSNLNEKFNNFPWKKNNKALIAWQQGLTGYPIVDAGMRELWETGWMHNRVRMIVGSFLVKDLMIHWLEGANWFENTLFDADLPNNSMGWQWVAGSGVDASPYFRIFNPMTQSEKFDGEAKYIRRWLPELKNLDNKWIHRPFDAPEMILKAANVKLGIDYPKPIVNHDSARLEALEAFKKIK